ncbi:hypothetical protein ABXT64_02455 [Candidatus Marifrigoribacter sp. Uisw_064]|jgi:hypothetical protein|uniref:hypothetical protein n=1 Tax=Candidatus Marifrigoribacter sp. Uisw_064 TaxID=3230970 RepID=UPI003D4CD493
MRNLALLIILLFTISLSAQRTKIKNLYQNDNKIGIGTDAPDHLLTVKGTIHSREVLVDLDGALAPDYVFEKYYTDSSEINPDYNMLSLSEIETYIKEHHHLPGIPSANKIKSEGLLLKQMNLLLLEKIEELTLFTIEQQKELDLLKEKLTVKEE